MASFRTRKGPQSAKFPTIGTTVEGTVIALADAPVPNFENGRVTGPKFNLDGSVFTQLDITVETATGEVPVILHTGGAMFDAIADALDETGMEDLVTGHVIRVTYVDNGPLPENSDYRPKLFAAVVAPAGTVLDAPAPPVNSKGK